MFYFAVIQETAVLAVRHTILAQQYLGLSICVTTDHGLGGVS